MRVEFVGPGTSFGIFIKFLVSFLLVYHAVVSLVVLSLISDLPVWMGVLYIASIGLAFYSFFSLFMNERRGAWCSLLCFGMMVFLNSRIGLTISYPVLGILLVMLLLLLRIGKKEGV